MTGGRGIDLLQQVWPLVTWKRDHGEGDALGSRTRYGEGRHLLSTKPPS